VAWVGLLLYCSEPSSAPAVENAERADGPAGGRHGVHHVQLASHDCTSACVLTAVSFAGGPTSEYSVQEVDVSLRGLLGISGDVGIHPEEAIPLLMELGVDAEARDISRPAVASALRGGGVAIVPIRVPVPGESSAVPHAVVVVERTPLTWVVSDPLRPDLIEWTNDDFEWLVLADRQFVAVRSR